LVERRSILSKAQLAFTGAYVGGATENSVIVAMPFLSNDVSTDHKDMEINHIVNNTMEIRIRGFVTPRGLHLVEKLVEEELLSKAEARRLRLVRLSHVVLVYNGLYKPYEIAYYAR